MRIGTAGSPSVIIDSNKNVGINNLYPKAPLTLQNILTLSDSFNVSTFRSNTYYDTSNKSLIAGYSQDIVMNANGGNAGDMQFRTTSAAAAGADSAISLVERMRLTAEGHFGIGTDDPTNKFVVSDGDQGFEVNPNASGEVRLTTYDRTNSLFKPFKIQPSSFIVSPSGTFDALIVKSTGEVGIGISDPENAAAGARNLVVNELDTTASAGITIRSAYNKNGNLYFADGTTGSSPYRGYFQYNHPADQLRIGVAGSEAIRILSNNDVGIGTTSPSARSSTYRALHVESSDTNAGGSLRLQNGSAQYSDILNYAEDLYFFSDGAFVFRDHASNQVLKIFNTGAITTYGTITVSSGTVTTNNYDMDADFAAIYSLLGDVNSALDAINGEVV